MTVDDVIRVIQETGRAHLLAAAATDTDISECEAATGLRVPEPYRQFLRFTNGAVLYETEELLGTQRPWAEAETIPEAVVRLRNSPSQPLPVNFLPFYNGQRGYYGCFRLTGSSAGEPDIVGWHENEGIVGTIFASFGHWFRVTLYEEYHSRYTE